MKMFLPAIAIVIIGSLGLVIDAQSRTPVVRERFSRDDCFIFATGRIEGTTPEVELRPQLAGRIDEIPVHEGQAVTAGQLLLRLDDQQYRCEVEMAKADLALAEAQLERLVNGARPQEISEAAAEHRAKIVALDLAKQSWGRIKELQASRAASDQAADNEQARLASCAAEADAAKARLELLEAPARPDEVRMDEARVAAAKARLAAAQVQLERASLKAPADGVILYINAEVGELTGPALPEPVIIMADTAHLQVRAFVEEIDAPRVRPGMETKTLVDGLPEREFKGTVYRISPRMGRKELFSDDPAERYDTKTREIWVELEDAAELIVGLRVDVVIDPKSGELQ